MFSDVNVDGISISFGPTRQEGTFAGCSPRNKLIFINSSGEFC